MSTTQELGKNFLAHYGVLGMKWGVRKDRSSSYSQDYARVRKLRNRAKKHSTRNLSNKDLEFLNKRANLEQQFKKLDPNALNRARLIIGGLIATGTTITTIYNLINSKAGQAAIKRGAEWLKRIK